MPRPPRFTPIALVLVLVVLWLSFRTVRGVVLPFSVLMALVWTLGIMVLAGKAITLGTFILPPLLLVVGSSYAIHVMARYYEQVDAGAPATELVVRAYQRVWLPLVISAFTTIVGFGSLMVNRITAIWDLGLFAVVGVALSDDHLARLHPRGARSSCRPTPRTRRIGQGLADARRRSSAARQLGLRVSAARFSGRALVIALRWRLPARRIHVDSDFLYYFKPELGGAASPTR